MILFYCSALTIHLNFARYLKPKVGAYVFIRVYLQFSYNIENVKRIATFVDDITKPVGLLW